MAELMFIEIKSEHLNLFYYRTKQLLVKYGNGATMCQ